MSININNFNLSYESFIKIINELYDEVIVYDNNYKIVYVNKACERHYAMSQEEMIGQSFWDFEGRFWDLSVLPNVYKKKKPIKQKQVTYLGADILTIAIPLFDNNCEIEYVVMSVRDNFEGMQIDYLSDLLNADIEKKRNFNNFLVYKSDQMKTIVETIDQIKDVSSPCLVLGETGVGKTIVGKYIYEKSEKYKKAFVHLNCAAIHKDLIETELFGYEQGTFTGAKKEGKKGLLEIADGGVLFLDEISEMPYNLQAKLLQFIQENEFYPVGSVKPIKVELKIIAATNRNLKKLVEMNNFREDLYYRLNVFEIEIPPLRDRKEDIIILTYSFLNEFNLKYKKQHKLSDDVKEILINYSWKGNIRELSHIIERLVVTVNGQLVMPCHLPKHLFEFENKSQINFESLSDAISDVEKRMVLQSYEELKSTRKVAEKLGISQSTASRLIRKYIQ